MGRRIAGVDDWPCSRVLLDFCIDNFIIQDFTSIALKS